MGPWPLLYLEPFLKNIIFVIENHFSLIKCMSPLLSVASSTSALVLKLMVCLFTAPHVTFKK